MNSARGHDVNRGREVKGHGGGRGGGSGQDDRRLRALGKRLEALELRVEGIERSVRLLGPGRAEDRGMLKQVLLQNVRDELADVIAELKASRRLELTDADARGSQDGGPERGGARRDAGRKVEGGNGGPGDDLDAGILGTIVEKLDAAREARENIYDFIMRLLIRQEINGARTKLLFISQRYEVEPTLFDELEQMENSVNNTFINTEELNLRWKVFEERVKAELERLRSD